MNSPVLDFYIVSYKRPQVLQYTLDHIVEWVRTPSYFEKVRFHVACNECTDDDTVAFQNFRAEISQYKFVQDVNGYMYNKNMGKAFALNEMMYETPDGENTFAVTMDGDMVFTDTYLEVMETTAQYLKFDLVGFASKQYYSHLPERDVAYYQPWHNYKLFYAMSIAGGIMMAPQKFLKEHKWTNVDGIYGGDDFNMCFNTESKFIVEDWRDWLEHDPIGPGLPELHTYYRAKKHYSDQGLFVFEKNWYEKYVNEDKR